MLVNYQKEHKLVMNDDCYKELKQMIRDFLDEHKIKYKVKRINIAFDNAFNDTYDETFQAMEAFIHNLNTMHCLPASEKIWVLDVKTNEFKSITMEDIDKSFEPNRFKVISLNKETGEAEFKFITHCKKLDNHRSLVKITDNQGRTVTVTDNHRIMTMDGCDITEDIPANCDKTISPRGIKFPPVKYDLCVADYGKDFVNDHLLVNESFAEFAGLYLACGEINRENNTCVLDLKDPDIEYIKGLLDDAFGYKVDFEEINGKVEIKLTESLLNMIEAKLGTEDSNKKVPNELILAYDFMQKTLLKTYHNNKLVESEPNKELCMQLNLMRHSLGIDSDLDSNLSCVKEKYPDLCGDIVGYFELDKLIDEYDKSELKKLERIFINNIETKEETNSGEEYVYDISVEDNENFLTYECIYVHNSRAGRGTAMVKVPVTWETLCPAV